MVNNYIPPTAQERETASAAVERLTRAANGDEALTYYIYDSQNEQPVELPAGAVAVLCDVLKFMSRGQGMTLFPRLAEVTTVEAADILNVSRPYVIKLLEAGEMPYRKVGSHRRIRLEDVLKHKAESDRQMDEAMDELVTLSQELGLYD